MGRDNQQGVDYNGDIQPVTDIAGIEVGDILDERYRIIEPLDAGGMGAIVRAEQLSMQRDVAIKLLHASMAEDAATVRRFQREIDLAKQLVHPNVIQLFDTGRTETGAIYLVMELLEGTNLKEAIASQPPMPAGRAFDIIYQVVDGLTDAHNLGIIHRDLKPANIFLLDARHRNVDRVKLLDFGIAKSLQGDQTAVTKAGQIVGTANYMAPELFLQSEPGPYTDVYSVGLIFLELLYGHRIVGGSTMAETVFQHLKQPIPMPGRLKHSPLGQVLSKATAKHPDDRYADAGALLQALEQLDGEFDPEFRFEPGAAPSIGGPPSDIDSDPSIDNSDTLAMLRQRSSHVTDESPSPNATDTRLGSRDAVSTDTLVSEEDQRAAIAEQETVQLDPSADIEGVSKSTDGKASSSVPGPGRSTLTTVVIALALGVGLGAWLMAPTSDEPSDSAGSEHASESSAGANATPEPVDEPESASDEETPGPAAAPKPSVVEVRVESSPDGATVLRDGEALGQTPLSVEISAGDSTETWRLTKPGHEASTVTIDTSSDGEYTTSLASTPKAPSDRADMDQGTEDDEPPPTPVEAPSEPSSPKSPETPGEPEPKGNGETSDDDNIDKIFDNTEF